MNALLRVLKYEWPSYNEGETGYVISFRIFNEEIEIYNDGDILIGTIRFINGRVIIDLSSYPDYYQNSSIRHFLVKVVSSTFTGVPILVASTSICY